VITTATATRTTATTGVLVTTTATATRTTATTGVWLGGVVFRASDL